MSNNHVVDERTLKMNFDNSNFEQNVSKTMSSLDKLKSSLKMKGASSGLDEVSKSANKISFNGLNSGLNTASRSLMSFGNLAKTILSIDLIRYLENLGTKFANAITIQPLKDGLAEYENQINSVQTIMSNTGADVKSVNAVLDELNRYADMTIYNFGQMTKNMGTFTAAMGNGSLDKAATAIKGIGNWAAYAGTNAEDMARATYQLSQSLSAGSIMLQDWKSIENTGGMAGKNFQNMFIETAREFGIKVDEMIEKAGNFRLSLKDGWLTTDVFIATMEKFANNEAMIDAATKVKTFSQLIDTAKEALGSGWAQVFRTIIGDFEEAKAFWTNISDTLTGDDGVITKFFDMVQKITDTVFTSKWDQLSSVLSRIGATTKDFKAALSTVYKEEYGQSLNSVIKQYGSLQNAITSGAVSAKDMKSALLLLFTTHDDGTKSIKNNAKSLEEFSKMADKVINGDFGNGAKRVKELTKAGWDYQKVQDIVNKKLKGEKIAIDDLTGSQKETTKLTKEQREEYEKLVKEINDPNSDISILLEQMTLPSGRELIIDTIANSWQALASMAGTIRDAFTDVFDTTSVSQKLYDILFNIAKGSRNLANQVEQDGPQIKSILSGLFSIIKMGVDIFKMAKTVVSPFIDALSGGLKSAILEHGSAIGDSITQWVKWFEASGKMYDIVLEIDKAILGFIGTIDDLMTSFKVLESVNALLETFGKGWDIAKNYFVEFEERIKNSTLFQAIVSGLQTVISNIPQGFINVVDTVAKFFNQLFDNGFDFSKVDVKGFFKGFTEGMFSVFNAFYEEGLKGVISKVKEFGSKIVGAFGDGVSTAVTKGSGFKTLRKGVESIANGVVNILGKIDLREFAAWGATGGFLTVLYKMTTAIGVFAKAAENFSQIALGAAQVLKSIAAVPQAVANLITITAQSVDFVIKEFGKTLRGVRWKYYAEAIKIFAEAVGVLVVALAGLTALSYYGGNSFWKAIVALEIIVADMVILMKVLDGLAKSAATLPQQTVTMVSLAGSLVLLAGALGVVSLAVGKLGKMKFEDYAQGMLGVALIIGAFIGIVALLGKIPAIELGKIAALGTMALKLSAALAIFAVVIGLCGTIGEAQAQRAIAVAAGLLIFIKLLSVATKNYGMVGSDLGTLMIKLAAAMAIIVHVTKTASEMSDRDLEQMIKFASGFLVFIGILNLVTRGAAGSAGLGATLIGVGGAIALMALSVQMLSQMSAGELAKGLACVVVFGLICAALIRCTDIFRGGSWGLSATLVGAGIAISTMAAIAVILGMVPLENLAKGVIAVGLLGLVVAALIKAIGSTTAAALGKVIPVMFAVGACIAVLGLIAYLLSNTADPTAIAAAGVAMAVMTAAMSLVVYTTKFATISLKAVGGIAMALVAVAAIGALLYLISDGINPQGALAASAGIAAVLLAMSAAMAIMGTFGTTIGPNALIGLGVLAVVAGVLGWILTKVDGINPKGAISNAVAIGALILALSAAMVPLAAAGVAGPAALIGAGTLLAFILACSALAIAIGFLTEKFPQIQEWINSGAPTLISLAEMAGKVIGAFAGGLVGQFAASSLVALGQGLSDFMNAIQPFINGAKNIKASDFEGVGALALAIVEICGAEFINKITTFLGVSGLDTFGDKLKQLGGALQTFSNMIGHGKVDTNAVKQASEAAKNLGSFLDSIPKEGLLHNAIFGTINWESFTTGIRQFGKAINEFGKYFKGGDTKNLEAIKTAAQAGKAVGDMANDLPKDGGIWQFFTGTTDWDTITNGIKKFGNAIVEFGKHFKGKSEDNVNAIKSAAQAGKAVGDMVKNLPKGEGIWQFFTGEVQWDKVSEGVKKYGEAMSSFGSSFKDSKLDLQTMKDAASAGTIIASMVESMPTSNKLVEFFCGDIKWDDISTGLKTYGNGIANFAKATAGIDIESITNGIDAGTKLAAFAGNENLMSDKGWMVNNKIDFGLLKKNLTALATSMTSFALITSGMTDPTVLNTAISGLKTLLSFGKDKGVLDNNMLIDGSVDFSNVKKNLNSLASALNQFNLISGVTNFEAISVASVGVTQLSNVGKEASKALPYFNQSFISFPIFTKQLSLGLKDFFENTTGISKATVINACDSVRQLLALAKDIGTTSSKPISEFVNGLEEIGKNAMDNFFDVFDKNYPNAFKVAAEVIQNVIDGLNSKEKKLNNTTKDLVEGVIDILDRNSSKSYKPGKDLADEYADGISKQKDHVKNVAEGVANSAAHAMNTGYTDAYNAGANIAQGLANGLAAWEQYVYNVAQRISNAATNAIRNAQQIHSPSRVQYKNGEYMGMGLAKGLASTFKLLKSTGSEAAEAANGGISKAIDGISRFFDSDIDTQPVIRPIVDLSDVEASKDRINGLSTLRPTMGLSASIRSIGSVRSNGIYSNDDVVNAVNGLSKRLDNIQPSNTYNVNGVTYDDGSNVSNAVGEMIRAIRLERRT